MFASLRGSLFNEGFVRQYASRASALVWLLGPVWLTPTVSYSSRAAMTEVITRAIEVREHMLASGPAEKWSSEQTERRSPGGFQRGVG